MNKEETNLRETLVSSKEENPMRKSFRGVIDETEDEIMVSFASLVLKSDEMLRMTFDGSSKFGEDFADDFGEDFEDDYDKKGSYGAAREALGPPPPPTVIPKFEPPVIEAPYSYYQYSIPTSAMSSSSSSPVDSSKDTKSKLSTVGSNVSVENSKPKRPLSAYNLFFQLERERLIAGVDPEEPFTAADVERIAIQRRELEQNPDRPKRKHRKSHGKISFAELARKIADKWKSLKPDAKDLLQERAAIEKTRYLRELEEWTKMNNTSPDGVYSPQATIKNEAMPPTPKKPTPLRTFVPSHLIPLPPRHQDNLIFQSRYSETSLHQPRMHTEQEFHRAHQSPTQHYQWMMYHYHQQQQQEQQYVHFNHSTNAQGYLEEHQQMPPVVTPTTSFDSSYDAPHDMSSSEPSFNTDRDSGWSSQSVYDIMREFDQRGVDRFSPATTELSHNEDDDVPRGVLDEVVFTPI